MSKLQTLNFDHEVRSRAICSERVVKVRRFAPHLEKCFGKGRQSSRIASQKISSSQVEYSGNNSLTKDDGEDDDWGAAEARKKRRKKKENAGNNKKNKKKSHLDVYQSHSTSSGNSTPRESPVLDLLSTERARPVSSVSHLSVSNHPPIISNKLIFNHLSHLQKAEDKAESVKNRKSAKKKR